MDKSTRYSRLEIIDWSSFSEIYGGLRKSGIAPERIVKLLGKAFSKETYYHRKTKHRK